MTEDHIRLSSVWVPRQSWPSQSCINRDAIKCEPMNWPENSPFTVEMALLAELMALKPRPLLYSLDKKDSRSCHVQSKIETDECFKKDSISTLHWALVDGLRELQISATVQLLTLGLIFSWFSKTVQTLVLTSSPVGASLSMGKLAAWKGLWEFVTSAQDTRLELTSPGKPKSSFPLLLGVIALHEK